MSSLLALPALLPTPSPASSPFQWSVAFTEQQDLALGSPGLNTGCHMTIQQAKKIWIQEQLFILYGNAWRWIYGIENIVTRGACATNLIV